MVENNETGLTLTWVSKEKLNSYGNLLFMRPPKPDLYRYIVSGTPEQQLRKKYSYAVEYPVTGDIRETPGVICEAKCVTGATYYNISFVYSMDLTLQAALPASEFYNMYPELVSWIPTMLPNGFWVAYPPSPLFIEDYMDTTDY